MILGILGALLIAGPLVYNKVIEPIILARNRPIWVTQNDGKLQVMRSPASQTFDYDQLKPYEDADVLQMSNPEVTDETLHKIENFKLLTELDLNNTHQITDQAALEILQSCPRRSRRSGSPTRRSPMPAFANSSCRATGSKRSMSAERPSPARRCENGRTRGKSGGLERSYMK